MLCYFTQISLTLLCYTLLNVIHGHTVAHATEYNVSSHREESSDNLLKVSHSKRGDVKTDTLENINSTKNLNSSDDKLLSQGSINNRTSPTIKPQLLEDVLNTTVGLSAWMNMKSGALQRTGYVALGFMSIIVAFFIFRVIRLRQKRSKSRKYGIITSTVSDMEMQPLDKDDDEEEDTTLFDAQHKYSLQ